MPTTAEINGWLAQNPGATDAQMKSAMDQYGVTTGMLSQATGWDQNTVQNRYNAVASTPTGGITVGGKNYTDQQVKDFYASGGNDVQFAQQAGMTDLGAIHDLAVKARGIGGAPTGDAALQKHFQQYQQANPTGAYANNYQSWVNDQGAHVLNAMKAGTYTGASVAPTDYVPGGIYGPGSAAYGKPGYASGLGPRGDGGTWGAPNTSPVTASPTGLISAQNTTTGLSSTPASSSSSSSYASGMSGFNPATDTTRGQVDLMLQKDSEFLQNARTGAMQIGNARGLLNSSITAGAGEKAAIDTAALIGDATANQYQKAKITTQELSNRMDLANLDADTRMKISQIDSAYKDKALASGDNQNALGNYRAIADNTNRMIQEILVSASLTPEAKQQAIDSVLMRHDEYIQFQDGITGLNLSSLITYTG